MLALIASLAGCRKKDRAEGVKKKPCKPEAVAHARSFLDQLCRAAKAAPAELEGHFLGLKLASAARPAVQKLPFCTLARQEPRRLWIDRKEVKGWGATFGKGARDRRYDAPPAGVAADNLLHESLNRTRKGHVCVAASPEVPIVQVEHLLYAAFEIGYRKVSFLVRPKNPVVHPPPPSTMRGYVRWKEGTDPYKHFDLVQKIVQRELGKWSDCKRLIQAHKSLGAASAEERCVLFGRVIMESLKECGCVTDPRPLLDAFHMSLQPYDQMGIWTARLDPRAGLDLTGRPEALWRDVVGRIVAGTEGAGFFLKVTPDVSDKRWVPSIPPGGRFRSRRMRVFVGTAKITGRLGPRPVRRVVKRHLYELKVCYRNVGLAANRKLGGIVRLKFVISSTGHVGSVEFVESTLNHKPMEACLKKAFKRWVFPGPDRDNATVILKMAFRPPGW
jgi:hypothetical protein